MCQLASIRQMSDHTGTPEPEVGLTTARPPWSTVPMGALAGRPYEPAKRSAVHGRHRELGGNVLWAGDWRRPYDYGDPEGETMAVHDAAGLIDVSTLGKLIVSGPEAGDFLNRLYPNRFDNLKPGRIRYGVLGDDAGRITDDGTICRLDEDSYYVTTTSSGADAVESWFAWWLAEWGMGVQLTDVSQGLSAFNLAGPRSREILSGLTDLDCSNDSFAYLDGKRAHVAGVPCLLLQDRVRRRARLRAPLPGLAGRAPLGRDRRRRRGALDPPLRSRAAEGAAASEAPHPRRPGHRRRVEPAGGGDALDRQVRQGGGLHRPLGAGVGLRARRARTSWSASASPTERCRPRGRRWWSTGIRSGG